MSAADIVANYPGGDAVLAAARKVEGADTGAITAAADRFSKAATGAGQHSSAVGAAVRGLDDAWQGQSADQFVTYMAGFGKAGTAQGEGLGKAADALRKVADAIDDAKHYVSTRAEQALGEIKRYLQQNPDVDQAQADAAIRPITSAAAGDIENTLAQTEEALRTAVGEVKAAANAAGRFTDIPDPGTQPYVPAPGKPVQWDRTPPPAQQTTTPSAAQNTSNGQAPSSGTGSTGGSTGTGAGGGGGGTGGGGGGLGSSGGPPGVAVPGHVDQWIREALAVLRANGINVSEADIPTIRAMIMKESTGNPHAINDWDSNAARGTPSKGLMQTIDPTFDAYKMPGHDDIWNPVDNICAGVNYAISRYGSLANVPGIKAMARGDAYEGY